MGLGASIKSKLGGLILPLLLERAKDEATKTKEGRAVWNKIKAFMNGKKTWTAFVMAAWPGIIAGAISLAHQAQAAGVPVSPETVAHIAAWGGPAVLGVLGLVHKAVKWLDDQTPDDPGTPAAKG